MFPVQLAESTALSRRQGTDEWFVVGDLAVAATVLQWSPESDIDQLTRAVRESTVVVVLGDVPVTTFQIHIGRYPKIHVHNVVYVQQRASVVTSDHASSLLCGRIATMLRGDLPDANKENVTKDTTASAVVSNIWDTLCVLLTSGAFFVVPHLLGPLWHCAIRSRQMALVSLLSTAKLSLQSPPSYHTADVHCGIHPDVNVATISTRGANDMERPETTSPVDVLLLCESHLVAPAARLTLSRLVDGDRMCVVSFAAGSPPIVAVPWRSAANPDGFLSDVPSSALQSAGAARFGTIEVDKRPCFADGWEIAREQVATFRKGAARLQGASSRACHIVFVNQFPPADGSTFSAPHFVRKLLDNEPLGNAASDHLPLRVSCVGVGRQHNARMLHAIASEGRGQYRYSSSLPGCGEELRTILASIVREARLTTLTDISCIIASTKVAIAESATFYNATEVVQGKIRIIDVGSISSDTEILNDTMNSTFEAGYSNTAAAARWAKRASSAEVHWRSATAVADANVQRVIFVYYSTKLRRFVVQRCVPTLFTAPNEKELSRWFVLKTLRAHLLYAARVSIEKLIEAMKVGKGTRSDFEHICRLFGYLHRESDHYVASLLALMHLFYRRGSFTFEASGHAALGSSPAGRHLDASDALLSTPSAKQHNKQQDGTGPRFSGASNDDDTSTEGSYPRGRPAAGMTSFSTRMNLLHQRAASPNKRLLSPERPRASTDLVVAADANTGSVAGRPVSLHGGPAVQHQEGVTWSGVPRIDTAWLASTLPTSSLDAILSTSLHSSTISDVSTSVAAAELRRTAIKLRVATPFLTAGAIGYKDDVVWERKLYLYCLLPHDAELTLLRSATLSSPSVYSSERADQEVLGEEDPTLDTFTFTKLSPGTVYVVIYAVYCTRPNQWINPLPIQPGRGRGGHSEGVPIGWCDVKCLDGILCRLPTNTVNNVRLSALTARSATLEWESAAPQFVINVFEHRRHRVDPAIPQLSNAGGSEQTDGADTSSFIVPTTRILLDGDVLKPFTVYTVKVDVAKNPGNHRTAAIFTFCTPPEPFTPDLEVAKCPTHREKHIVSLLRHRPTFTLQALALPEGFDSYGHPGDEADADEIITIKCTQRLFHDGGGEYVPFSSQDVPDGSAVVRDPKDPSELGCRGCELSEPEHCTLGSVVVESGEAVYCSVVYDLACDLTALKAQLKALSLGEGTAVEFPPTQSFVCEAKLDPLGPWHTISSVVLENNQGDPVTSYTSRFTAIDQPLHCGASLSWRSSARSFRVTVQKAELEGCNSGDTKAVTSPLRVEETTSPRITLANLESDTVYHVRIAGAGCVEPVEVYFRTAPLPPTQENYPNQVDRVQCLYDPVRNKSSIKFPTSETYACMMLPSLRYTPTTSEPITVDVDNDMAVEFFVVRSLEKTAYKLLNEGDSLVSLPSKLFFIKDVAVDVDSEARFTWNSVGSQFDVEVRVHDPESDTPAFTRHIPRYLGLSCTVPQQSLFIGALMTFSVCCDAMVQFARGTEYWFLTNPRPVVEEDISIKYFAREAFVTIVSPMCSFIGGANVNLCCEIECTVDGDRPVILSEAEADDQGRPTARLVIPRMRGPERPTLEFHVRLSLKQKPSNAVVLRREAVSPAPLLVSVPEIAPLADPQVVSATSNTLTVEWFSETTDPNTEFTVATFQSPKQAPVIQYVVDPRVHLAGLVPGRVYNMHISGAHCGAQHLVVGLLTAPANPPVEEFIDSIQCHFSSMAVSKSLEPSTAQPTIPATSQNHVYSDAAVPTLCFGIPPSRVDHQDFPCLTEEGNIDGGKSVTVYVHHVLKRCILKAPEEYRSRVKEQKAAKKAKTGTSSCGTKNTQRKLIDSDSSDDDDGTAWYSVPLFGDKQNAVGDHRPLDVPHLELFSIAAMNPDDIRACNINYPSPAIGLRRRIDIVTAPVLERVNETWLTVSWVGSAVSYLVEAYTPADVQRKMSKKNRAALERSALEPSQGTTSDQLATIEDEPVDWIKRFETAKDVSRITVACVDFPCTIIRFVVRALAAAPGRGGGQPVSFSNTLEFYCITPSEKAQPKMVSQVADNIDLVLPGLRREGWLQVVHEAALLSETEPHKTLPKLRNDQPFDQRMSLPLDKDWMSVTGHYTVATEIAPSVAGKFTANGGIILNPRQAVETPIVIPSVYALENFVLLEATETSVEVGWDSSSCADYFVTLHTHREHGPAEMRRVTTKRQQACFTNLEPGTLHTLTVRGSKCGDASLELKALTVPILEEKSVLVRRLKDANSCVVSVDSPVGRRIVGGDLLGIIHGGKLGTDDGGKGSEEAQQRSAPSAYELSSKLTVELLNGEGKVVDSWEPRKLQQVTFPPPPQLDVTDRSMWMYDLRIVMTLECQGALNSPILTKVPLCRLPYQVGVEEVQLSTVTSNRATLSWFLCEELKNTNMNYHCAIRCVGGVGGHYAPVASPSTLARCREATFDALQPATLYQVTITPEFNTHCNITTVNPAAIILKDDLNRPLDIEAFFFTPPARVKCPSMKRHADGVLVGDNPAASLRSEAEVNGPLGLRKSYAIRVVPDNVFFCNAIPFDTTAVVPKPVAMPSVAKGLLLPSFVNVSPAAGTHNAARLNIPLPEKDSHEYTVEYLCLVEVIPSSPQWRKLLAPDANPKDVGFLLTKRLWSEADMCEIPALAFLEGASVTHISKVKHGLVNATFLWSARGNVVSANDQPPVQKAADRGALVKKERNQHSGSIVDDGAAVHQSYLDQLTFEVVVNNMIEKEESRVLRTREGAQARVTVDSLRAGAMYGAEVTAASSAPCDPLLFTFLTPPRRPEMPDLNMTSLTVGMMLPVSSRYDMLIRRGATTGRFFFCQDDEDDEVDPSGGWLASTRNTGSGEGDGAIQPAILEYVFLVIDSQDVEMKHQAGGKGDEPPPVPTKMSCEELLNAADPDCIYTSSRKAPRRVEVRLHSSNTYYFAFFTRISHPHTLNKALWSKPTVISHTTGAFAPYNVHLVTRTQNSITVGWNAVEKRGKLSFEVQCAEVAGSDLDKLQKKLQGATVTVINEHFQHEFDAAEKLDMEEALAMKMKGEEPPKHTRLRRQVVDMNSELPSMFATFSGLSKSKRYGVRVRSKHLGGSQDWSMVLWAAPTTPPVPVTALQCLDVTHDSIKVRWQDPNQSTYSRAEGVVYLVSWRPNVKTANRDPDSLKKQITVRECEALLTELFPEKQYRIVVNVQNTKTGEVSAPERTITARTSAVPLGAAVPNARRTEWK